MGEEVKQALPFAALVLFALASCDQPAPANRVELTEPRPALPQVMMESPDTSEGYWSVAPNGHAIRFGDAGEPPLLTLDCILREGAEPQMEIIRHAPASPGLTAIFPIIGNGVRSRFMADAVLDEGEWRWEASEPADDGKLEVFTGTRQILATLPGRGMLDIHGSRIPGEFVTWCRAGREIRDVRPETAQERAENQEDPDFK